MADACESRTPYDHSTRDRFTRNPPARRSQRRSRHLYDQPSPACRSGDSLIQARTCARASLQIFVQEIEDRLVAANLVRLLRETVAFVVEDDVLDHAFL